MLSMILLVVLIVVLNSTAQVLLKKATTANKNEKRVFLLLGYSLFVIVVFLVQVLLRYIEFKSLAIIITLNLLGVMFASVLFLDEKLTTKKVFGTLLVGVGSVIFLT